ncbi:MAG: hypothetical protein NTX86_01545 [Candidatus Dependentiae bacterium]|nr:hypothetical protein [Candidatus Dependentiae bacterium]
MELLRTLEEKISSLVGIIRDLKTQNEVLKAEADKAHVKHEALSKENATLLQENAQLTITLNAMENSMLKDNERMEETKIVVDDLIKSIDALVGNEHQK